MFKLFSMYGKRRPIPILWYHITNVASKGRSNKGGPATAKTLSAICFVDMTIRVVQSDFPCGGLAMSFNMF